jgi:uncharacterized protein (TIGR03083 family)
MTSPHWPSLRPSLVDHGRLLHSITVEGELLVQAATGARESLPVPSRPGVTLGDAVRHTGSEYQRALAWLRSGTEPADWQRVPAPGQDVVGFHVEGREALVAELAAHEPDEPCDTWWPADRTYGFWRRRMAHETAVHRVDVQGAMGMSVDPVEEDFAADGIDEALLFWFGYRLAQRGMTATQHGAVGVMTAGYTWLAVLGRVRSSARRVPAVDAQAADAVVAGEPMSVYLWVWGRVSDQAVEISGDPDAKGQLWALLHIATGTR